MKLLEKAKFVGKVFTMGAKPMLEEKWVWGAATFIGLHQGLKYKGSIKTGTLSGLAVLGVISGANGIYNIVLNWDEIMKVLKED